MLRWKRGWVDSAQALITMEAAVTLVEGDIVTFLAPDALGLVPKAGKLTGGAGDTSRAFGIALHGALDEEQVQVRMILPGDEWVADAAAATVVARIGELAAFNTSQEVIVTTGVLGCTRVRIVGIEGALADKKYVVMFEPYSDVDLSIPYVQSLEVTADASAGISFTVSERIQILDALCEARASEANVTMQVVDSADAAITSTMACITDAALTRATTIDDSKAVVAKGGTVKVLAGGAGTKANGRAVVTIIGKRL